MNRASRASVIILSHYRRHTETCEQRADGNSSSLPTASGKLGELSFPTSKSRQFSVQAGAKDGDGCLTVLNLKLGHFL